MARKTFATLADFKTADASQMAQRPNDSDPAITGTGPIDEIVVTELGAQVYYWCEGNTEPDDDVTVLRQTFVQNTVTFKRTGGAWKTQEGSTASIEAGAITTAKLADGAVVSPKLGAGAFAVSSVVVKSDHASAAAGSAGTALRSDAGLVVQTGTPVAPGDALAAGASDSLSRADHVHSHGNGRRTLEIAVAHAATTDSTGVLPAGAYVRSCQIVIGTSYSGGGTISVGQAGALTAFMDTGDSNPQGSAGDIHEKIQRTAVSASGLVVRVTVGGAPAAGACTVVIEYEIPAG